MTTEISPELRTKFILVGATGKLGKSISSNNARVTYGICSKDNPLLGEVIEGIQEPLISSLSEVSLKIADIPLVIDASYPENFDKVYDFCHKNQIPLVLASTGHTKKQLVKLDKLAKKVAVLKAPNLSEGIAFFKTQILKPIIRDINFKTNKIFIESGSVEYDISDVKIKIIETHHDKKKDAPSGTAIDLKNYILKGLGHMDSKIEIESIRDKSSVGKHEVIFRLKSEEFSLSHNALSREIFGQGISLAEHIMDKKPGIYSMTSLLEDF
jgi:4-hydroxy-tetrahydrodipicolinate reductase